jgi:hypothetical protein
VEALVVELNGSTKRPDGNTYHITWSLAEGRKPVESNIYVGRASSVTPISITVIPKVFS